MKIDIKIVLFFGFLLFAVSTSAQLAITTAPPKIIGQKAIVTLGMKNQFGEKIESARASVFLTDGQGTMLAQRTQWVINSTAGKSGLSPGATNAFNFVLDSKKPFESTNLTAKVVFNRVVLEGGKFADPAKEVIISTGSKR